MILVTTAGQVGSETARLLAQREVPVRVLVRDPEKAKTLAGVAAVAASIAASPAPPAGQTYWLTGPALISYYDVAAVLSKLLGRAVTYRELTFDQDKDTMIRAGVPEQIAEMNAQAASLTADGDAAWVTDDVPSLLGRPARSFGEFAAGYATAFS